MEKRKKIELLAPCGDLEKLKIAVMYGADAVYIGGKKFSLRARASNFSMEDIKSAVEFSHKYGSKVHVTMNIVRHNEDLEGLDEYLLELEKYHVDAIIVCDLSIAKRALELTPNIEVHISTQLSSLNHETVNFLHEFGAKRVVIGREASLESLRSICEHAKCEVEAFIHGGMCVSYSGRCMLSNYMTNRDANRGGCAHSCRWNYYLYDENKDLLSPSETYFNMGSKDLSSVDYICDLIDMGVSSLKIEGRMKSTYYIATVVRTYRMLIDEYYEKGKLSKERLDFYKEEILKAENRLTSSGFLDHFPQKSEQLFDTRTEVPTKEFIGVVLSYDDASKECVLEQRNYFKPGDKIEFFGPNLKNTTVVCGEITDIDGNILECARHPKQIIKMNLDFKVSPYDMMRLVK